MVVANTETELDLSVWADRPAAFFPDILGSSMYPKQIEMAESVRDYRRTAVVGCNSSGKDYAAARILCWWQATRYPAKTVVIGPTHRQVSDVVWQEVRAAYRVASYRAKPGLGGDMYPRASRWYDGPDHFSIGFATDDALRIQGFHSPNLLCILTEAHAIRQADIEAVKRLNPARILLTGNALSDGGEFFQAFHPSNQSDADLYNTISISAFDTPNLLYEEDGIFIPGMITAQDIEERKNEWGEESALYVAGILGRFPDSLSDAVVPRSVLLAAVGRELEPWNTTDNPAPRAILSCDVARFGGDRTVVYRRQGGRCRLAASWMGKSTQETAGLLGRLAEADEDVDRIVVDDVGVGGGVTDRLRESPPKNKRGGISIVAFNGGAAARHPSKYANAISEAWLELAEEFIRGKISIENDPALISQLSSRRRIIQGDRTLRLETKKDYKNRTGISPDNADALAMTMIATRGGPRISWA